VGQYLQSLKEKFPGELVADMLCMLRIHLELSIRAKGILLMREHGFKPKEEPDIRDKFAELEYLEKSVGKTGMLAIKPFLHTTSRTCGSCTSSRGEPGTRAVPGGRGVPRRALLAAALLLLSSCGGEPPAGWKAEVAAVLEAQASAWNRGDIAGYMEGYWKSDSLLFTSGGAVRRVEGDVREVRGLLRHPREDGHVEVLGTGISPPGPRRRLGLRAVGAGTGERQAGRRLHPGAETIPGGVEDRARPHLLRPVMSRRTR